jgi:protein-L-isoaspartate(D-aspartate) O-methyltransferase
MIEDRRRERSLNSAFILHNSEFKMVLDDYIGQRERMVRTQMESRGIADPRVLAAFRKVPRHRFMPEGIRSRAYEDTPLPIGEGQTISQPYTVARMTEALELTDKRIVLEIGTGSGYQAAILAELAEWVYSVERLRNLSGAARNILDELGYHNVATKVGDGTLGWSEHAPYDAVIVTAGGPSIPQPLVDQLQDGGRLVMPVGDPYSQSLILGVKRGGRLETDNLGPYRFVELVGEHGWKH